MAVTWSDRRDASFLSPKRLDACHSNIQLPSPKRRIRVAQMDISNKFVAQTSVAQMSPKRPYTARLCQDPLGRSLQHSKLILRKVFAWEEGQEEGRRGKGKGMKGKGKHSCSPSAYSMPTNRHLWTSPPTGSDFVDFTASDCQNVILCA